MKPLFDPEAIRIQIANLQADRARIDQAIQALEGALRNLENLDSHQRELAFELQSTPGLTLQDAVKRVSSEMIDAITRPRVLNRIEQQFPALRPNPSSVSAAMINLSRGEPRLLYLAIPGIGRSPAVYSTQADISLQLNNEEIADLMAPVIGSGGWQSLWVALQKNFDKSTGQITLTPINRARLYQYYHNYGGGGFQNRAKRVFRRHLPHLFASANNAIATQ